MKSPVPFGKYLLIDRINVGGMAEVYKGKTIGVEGFEKLVAIKRILPNIAEDDEFITMFIDEAKISVQLNHANVAQIYDLGKISESYFIAMEYIPGKDVRAIFDRMRKRGEILPVPMSCFIGSRMCEGLDYAHRKKDPMGRDMHIVHRDVSPQNILVSFEGEVKVIDFGIAKAANKASKTQAGILKGKFGYMSPEQVRGLPIDRRSDVFAVGVVLYELLTGERLFVGESDFSVLEKVRNVDVVPPSTYNRRIPESLERIVLKALARDVDERYAWASELQEDLQRFLITSDTIYSRKDLASFMKAAFAEDLEREKIRNQQAMMGIGSEEVEELKPPAEGDRTELIDSMRQFGKAEKPAPPAAPAWSPPPLEMSSPASSRPAYQAPAPRPAPGPPNLKPEGLATVAEGLRSLPTPPRPEAPRSPPSHPARSRDPLPESPERSRFPLIAGVIVLLAALFGGGAFLFLGPRLAGNGKGVLIVRGPPDAPIFLNGTRVGQLPYIDSRLAPGRYEVRVETEGHEPFVSNVSVLPGEKLEVDAALRKAPAKARILVVTVPLDAEIALGNTIVKDGGTDPWQSGELDADVEHRMVIRKSGFRDGVITWKPEPGQSKTFTVQLVPSRVRLVVESQPDRAKVLINGELKGRTPLTLDEVDSSPDQRLRLERGGCWEDWESTLLFDGAAEKRIEVDLDKKASCGGKEVRPGPNTPNSATGAVSPINAVVGEGRLRLNTKPGWASVLIDGKDTGRQTPLMDYPLPAGPHAVTVRSATGNEKTVEITIVADQLTTRIVELD